MALSIDERDQLLSETYDELRRAAARMLRYDAPSLTLQPTDLVNEAALRIVRLEAMSWNDQRHFFATSARIMRQAMVDAIRHRKRGKRNAPTVLLTVDHAQAGVDVEALDAALAKLETVSPDLAQLVEMRFFVGLRPEEVAGVLGMSESTVKRRWRTARLWLARELSDPADD